MLRHDAVISHILYINDYCYIYGVGISFRKRNPVIGYPSVILLILLRLIYAAYLYALFPGAVTSYFAPANV